MRASDEAQLSKRAENIRKLHYSISRISACFSELRLLSHGSMFLTNDANKHPLSDIYGESNHVWIAAEVQLRLPFFMVDFDQHAVDNEGDDFSLGRTVLLSRGDDVLKLVSDLKPHNSLKSVALLTPASGKAGCIWSVDQLTAIWEAEDPSDSHLKYKIFSKADGSYYVDSMMGPSASQLQEWHQLSVLPTGNRHQ